MNIIFALVASVAIFGLSGCDRETEGQPPDGEVKGGISSHKQRRGAATKFRSNERGKRVEWLILQLEENSENLEFDQWVSILEELSAKDSARACRYLVQNGLGRPNMGRVKSKMFQAMLINTPEDQLTPILESLVKQVSKMPEGHETAQALIVALGKQAGKKGEVGYMSCVRPIFAGKNGLDMVIKYFTESAGQLSKEKSLEMIEKLGIVGKQKKEATLAVAFQVRDSDPEGAFKLLNELSPEFVGGTYGEVLAAWMNKDLERSSLEIRKMPSNRLASLMMSEDFIKMLSQDSNRELALNVTSKIPFNQRSAAGLKILMGHVLERDPKGACKLVLSMPDGPLKSRVVRDVWSKINLNNTAEAHGILAEIPASLRSDIALSFMGTLASKDIQEADVFVKGLEFEERRSMMGHLIHQYATRSHTKAAEVLAREIKQNGINDVQANLAGKSIGLVWVNQDRTGAVEWANNLPMPARAGAYASIVKSWSTIDAAGASKWLMSMEPSRARNEGIRALIAVYKEADPNVAKQWQELLDDE